MIRLEITNLPAFQRSLEKLTGDIQDNIKDALRAGAQDLAVRAKERVPVKSGELRDSIVTLEGGEGMNYIISATAPHARFVEFGTRKTPARPFMVPAAEEVFPQILDNLAGAINKAIRN
ncbi:MAG: HK97 gp10 family phage protein [Proteobacteria bacterium]|nr:HK97 gp10 family phage protein [Pseudomonadota bacterium]